MENQRQNLDALSARHFAELLRTTFQVLVEPGLGVRLELTAVTETGPGRPEGVAAAPPRGECFSLLFDGPADPPLAQRTYRLAHERLGAFDLFLVPVGAEHGARQYEAVFHRCPAPAPAGK